MAFNSALIFFLDLVDCNDGEEEYSMAFIYMYHLVVPSTVYICVLFVGSCTSNGVDLHVFPGWWPELTDGVQGVKWSQTALFL